MEFEPAATPPDRVAAVDLGSNCFHVLIADIARDCWRPVVRRRYRVGLALGLNGDAKVQTMVQQKADAALAEIAGLLAEHACRRTHIVGTCAMREMAQVNPLLTSVERALGAPVRVISGTEEARLIYLGAMQTLPQSGMAPRLVIDIGGGSTEIAYGRGAQVERCISLPLGCIAISEFGLAHSESNSGAVMQRCLQAAREVVSSAPLDAFADACPRSVIGTSGSAESICAVAGAGPVSAAVLGIGQLRQVCARLAAAPRLPVALPGLEPGRERVFPGSVAILLALWERLGFSELRWTEGALQDGLLQEVLTAR